MVVFGREYRGIIFDLDGTLYKKKGIGKWFFLPMVRHMHSMMVYKRHRALLMNSDFQTYEALQEQIYSEIEKSNHKKTRQKMEELENKFHRVLMRTLEKHLSGREGINQVLELLAEHIPLACLSDYQEVPERLDCLGIERNHFTFLASSPEMGALKPAVRPFLAAAEAMGVSPESCLIIGDQDDTDGAAADQTGMGYLKIAETTRNGGYCWKDVATILLEGVGESVEHIDLG